MKAWVASEKRGNDKKVIFAFPFADIARIRFGGYNLSSLRNTPKASSILKVKYIFLKGEKQSFNDVPMFSTEEIPVQDKTVSALAAAAYHACG